MADALLRTGYDFAERYLIRLDSSAEDLSTATIEASLKNSTKTTELIADTAQANTGGADWANGVVEIIFPAASTTGLTAGSAWIEVAITKGGYRRPCPDLPVIIETGFTL